MAEISQRALDAWQARRALHEQFGAGLDLIARAAALSAAGVARRAGQEGWQAPRVRAADGGTLSQRIGRLAEKLVGEMEAIERAGAASGFDKARIEAVTALTRALEKAGEIGEARVERQQEQKKTDAEIAELLGRMDDRIVELARREADRLVAAELAAGQAG